MLPYATLIALDRHAAASLVQQLSKALRHLIQQGLLPPGSRLPGARTLADQLQVHRQTVMQALDELAAQGWLDVQPARAAVVSLHLPDVPPQPLRAAPLHFAAQAGFAFTSPPPLPNWPGTWPLDEGSPDGRLAPLAELARYYRAASRRLPQQATHLGYTDPNGSLRLRQRLAQYLHDTRGIPAGPEHLFTTRGSIQGLYLLARLVLAPGDIVVVAERSYPTADALFTQCGGRVHRVGLDAEGLVVDQLAALCQRQRVRLVYLTPHHHFPTTVTLSAARRRQLLRLAEAHDFILLEDDYDFEYHYAGSPILPLASADRSGRVLYVGSVSKVLAPSIRLGYVVAPPDIVAGLTTLRRLVDRQGDVLLEEAVAELLAAGELERHIRRTRRLYQQRRDACCTWLRAELAPWCTVTSPAGGMAVWACFRPEIDLPLVAAQAQALGLGLSSGIVHPATGTLPGGLRLGFASQTSEELIQRLALLRQALHQLYPAR